MNKAKPFLKWAGGKRQLIPILEENLPKDIKGSKEIALYAEPFIGGGALLFHLLSNYKIKRSIINDINPDLMITYFTVQQYPEYLIEELSSIEKEYTKLGEEKRREYYYDRLRKPFNEIITSFEDKNRQLFVKKASLLIALNRLCFNGLFRQNSKGEFNVPMGRYKEPQILDKENILNSSKLLKNTEIYCGTYNKIKLDDDYDKRNLIYLDPPYRPLSKTSSFTKYSKEDFNDEDQKELAKYVKEMRKKGFNILLSNSDTRDGFFEDLYKGFEIKRVQTKRFINSNVKGRKEINELIIRS